MFGSPRYFEKSNHRFSPITSFGKLVRGLRGGKICYTVLNGRLVSTEIWILGFGMNSSLKTIVAGVNSYLIFLINLNCEGLPQIYDVFERRDEGFSFFCRTTLMAVVSKVQYCDR